MKTFYTLKDIRIENELTQQKLATILGISRASISNYERGFRTVPDEICKKVKEIFNIDLDNFNNKSLKNKRLNLPEYINLICDGDKDSMKLQIIKLYLLLSDYNVDPVKAVDTIDLIKLEKLVDNCIEFELFKNGILKNDFFK